MGRNRRASSGPSDPLQMMEARAAERAAARIAARDPASWGVDAEILTLPTSGDIALVSGARGAVIAANRSDPFDLLYKAGGLSVDQHRAARRLFRDWCLRAGVRDREHLVLDKIDGGRSDPSGSVSDAMIAAGGRIATVLRGNPAMGISGVGPVNAALLEALISPLVDEGRIAVWRVQVERATGISERNSQGAIVRLACESLRLVYDEIDRRWGVRRIAPLPANAA